MFANTYKVKCNSVTALRKQLETKESERNLHMLWKKSEFCQPCIYITNYTKSKKKMFF